jgi:hypothetical protein
VGPTEGSRRKPIALDLLDRLLGEEPPAA